MKIKLRTHYAGPCGNHAPGTVVDLPDAEARGLVDCGYAVTFGEIGHVVNPPPPVETTRGIVQEIADEPDQPEPERVKAKRKKKKWGR